MAKMNWRTVNAKLGDMTEAELKALLDEEAAVHKRPTILRRVHQRYSAVRVARERDELLEGLE